MTLDIRQNTAGFVFITPPTVWTAPTLEILDPSGADVTGTATATPSTVSTTVVSATASTLTLASVAGIEPARHLQVTTDGVPSVVYVTSINTATTTVGVYPPVSLIPAAADPVVGVDVYVQFPATVTAQLGVGYQIVLTDADSAMEERVQLNVVRRLFTQAYRRRHLRALFVENWPSDVPTEAELLYLAEEIRDEVRQDLYATGRYPTIYIDPVVFRALAETTARRLIAIRRGLYPGNVDDRDVYLERLQDDRQRQIGRITRSFAAVDADDDGAVDEANTRVFAMRRKR